MRSLFWISAVMVVISCVGSVHLWRELHALRHQASTGGQPAAALPSASLSQTAAPAALPASPPAAATRQTGEIAAFTALVKQQEELRKDPAYRKAMLIQARNSIRRDNPFLAEELGLSQSEADGLVDLLAEQSLSVGQRGEAIAALLGPEKYAQWQQYEELGPARSRANSVRSLLAEAGQPLSMVQLKLLTAALVPGIQTQREEAKSLPRINPQDPGATMEIEAAMRKQQETADQRMLAAAAPVVSAQQLTTLRTRIEAQAAMSRAMFRAIAAKSQQTGKSP